MERPVRMEARSVFVFNMSSNATSSSLVWYADQLKGLGGSIPLVARTPRICASKSCPGKTGQRLEEISLRPVMWVRSPSRYTVDWRVVALSNGRTFEPGARKIEAGTTRDWQRVKFLISVVS